MPTGGKLSAASGQGALVCVALGGLFPPGVVGAQLSGPGPIDAQALLTEQEWSSIADCGERRIRDFTAGRLCAHRALQEFGVGEFSVLAAPDRRALWPLTLSGSITHTEGYAAAVVGRTADVGSLGVDCERVDAVEPDLWGTICTAAELEALAERSPPERAQAAALCFVAKEAFYKAQFALVREQLEFSAVSVQLPRPLAVTGAFRIVPLRRIGLQGYAGDFASGWEGRFRYHDGYVTAGIALPARIE